MASSFASLRSAWQKPSQETRTRRWPSRRHARQARLEWLEDRLAPAGIGVAIDNSAHRLLIFDPATGTQTGLVTIPTTSADTLDTVISPAGNFAYVSDFEADRVWVVDLTTDALATGTNPISVSTNPEDLDITGDGRYLLVSDGGGGSFAVVDTTSRNQVAAGNTPGGSANAIATRGTDVLISSELTNSTYRYSTNTTSGALTYTGQLTTAGGHNVAISPNGTTALVTPQNSAEVFSVLVSGMTAVSATGTPSTVIGAAFSPDGTRFYVRTLNSVVGYSYNPTTGAIVSQLFNSIT
jgi:DNA-binding beta-propeller fold protein YncE